MSKARELANLGNAYSDGALSNRNLIINGAMQVAQRGNRSPSGFTGSFYAGPDRWLVNRSGTGTTGFSQISSTDFGAANAAQATFLAAAGETFIVTQRIESANIAHLAGQEVTLSFWVSGSSDAGSATLNASLSYAGAANNFTSETVIGSPQSIAYTGTAQRITMTVTLPSGAANGVAVRIAGTKTDATGTFTLTFGGVQLEVGDTATPFEHRSYGQELALCQRYYWLHAGSEANGTYLRLCQGMMTSTTQADGHVMFPQKMRAIPTVTSGNDIAAWNGTSVRNGTTFGLGTDGSNPNGAAVYLSGISGGTAYHPVQIILSNNNSGYFAFDAEL
jgi:hypothetical protein